MRAEARAALAARNRARATHGMSRTPIYAVWRAMVRRCRNPDAEYYHLYGGRGIAVCDEWAGDFLAFFRHVGHPPFVGAQIDRIENSGGYAPGNVRWVTGVEQQRNKRSNRLLTLNGETHALQEWSERTGIGARTIHKRVSMLGWSDHDALSVPVRPLRSALTIDGRTMRICDWAALSGANQKTVALRLFKGWCPRDAVFGRESAEAK